MPKTTRRFVDKDKVGTRRPADSTGRTVFAGMKDADWQCNSCGSPEEIPATIKVCPNCRNPKDASEGYHSPSSPRPYLTQADMDARGIDMERQQDEECPFCESRLTSKTEVCPNCGGNVSSVYKAERICPSCERETNNQNCPACGTATLSKSLSTLPKASTTKLQNPARESKKHSSSNLAIGAVVSLVLLCIFAAIGLLFKPHDEIGSVASNSWTCSVPLQEYQYNRHSDWTLPEGADLIQSYEKFHHNEKVEDGLKEVCEDRWEVVGYDQVPKTKEVCTPGEYIETIESCDEETSVCTYTDVYGPDSCVDVPDGFDKVDVYDWVTYCEDKMQYKEVPVNQIYFEYNIWEWVSINPATTSGNNNQVACPLVTPSQTIKQSGNPDVSCQTEFTVGNKNYPYTPDCLLQFPLFSEGSQWLVTISGPSIIEVSPVP